MTAPANPLEEDSIEIIEEEMRESDLEDEYFSDDQEELDDFLVSDEMSENEYSSYLELKKEIFSKKIQKY